MDFIEQVFNGEYSGGARDDEFSREEVVKDFEDAWRSGVIAEGPRFFVTDPRGRVGRGRAQAAAAERPDRDK